MRFVMSALLAIAVAASVPLLATRSVAYAAFHCVRIHAVAGGYNADGNIQYVELRMDMGGQTLLGGHALQFFDAAGTLKATFTFPSGVANGAVGDSVLIATSQFNSNVTGGPSDFTFTNANTTGANGGDPLHPVQAPNGSVVWAGPSAACVTVMAPVDSVAYGSASAVYGSAAVALPNPSTLQALRLSNLNSTPSNNSTEYALTNVSTATFGVAVLHATAIGTGTSSVGSGPGVTVIESAADALDANTASRQRTLATNHQRRCIDDSPSGFMRRFPRQRENPNGPVASMCLGAAPIPWAAWLAQRL